MEAYRHINKFLNVTLYPLLYKNYTREEKKYKEINL